MKIIGGKFMNDFSWIHLSDLHMQQFEDFDVQNMRIKLIETLKKIQEIKYVFITGDIANRFNYSNAKEFISDIKAATSVATNHIFWSVGNHDITRDNRSRNNIIKNLRRKKKESFEILLKDDENRNLLIDFEFKEYINQHKIILEYETTLPHAVYELDDVFIINLNTCITSYDDNDAHQLNVIEAELHKLFSEVKKDSKKPVFVIGHHSIDLFKDSEKEKIQELFDEKVDVYLCGHAHRLGYMTIPNTDSEVHEFTCGGGINDNYSVYSFMYGKYDSNKKGITIIPYSYRNQGNKKWQEDYSLHRKLDNCNNIFYFKRLLTKNEKNVLESANYKFNSKNGNEDISSSSYSKLLDEIHKFHLDKRIKISVDTQGLDNVCKAYTRYFNYASIIPNNINYIKDGNMFLELADIVVNTKSSFPLYVSGEIGTGKSSFLSLLFLALCSIKMDILPIYFDLHSYEEQDKKSATYRFNEDTKLIENIIKEEKFKDIIFFVDGLDDHNRLIGDLGINWLKSIIDNFANEGNKKIISLGLWNENSELNEIIKQIYAKPVYSIVLKRIVSINKNNFIEYFVRTQIYDDKIINDNISMIKNVIEKWKLEKVDFRLLCMIIESDLNLIEKSNTYTSFLYNYCYKLLNYKEHELNRIAKEAFMYHENNFSNDKIRWEINNNIIYKHQEICSFLIAFYFTNVIKSDCLEDQIHLIKKDFVFSKETNTHIKNLIIKDNLDKKNYYTNLKQLLNKKDISLDMKAQICYLLPRVFEHIKEVKKLLLKELELVKKQVDSIEKDTYNDYEYVDKDNELILLYRTIVCSLAICGSFEPLYDFIKRLLLDENYRILNKQFYCDYYANILEDASLKNISLIEVDKEKIVITLTQLRHQILRAIYTKSFSNYNLFVLDIVTYFSIVQTYLSFEKTIFNDQQIENAKELLSIVLKDSEAQARITKVQELCSFLQLLHINFRDNETTSIGVLKNLYSLKKRKRAGWEKRGITDGETIADHIFGAYLLGLVYLPQNKPKHIDIDYSEYCKDTILTMLLLHDLGEAYTGDIVSTQKTDEEKFKEQQFVKAIFMSSTFEETANLEKYKLVWEDYVGGNSVNARIAHEIDKIENLVQLYLYNEEKAIEDFNEWKVYIKERVTTRVGKRIFEFLDNSFSNNSKK